MELTYLGSGICSYNRRIAGAILSVTVPEITTRSAWRGEAGKGMTPRRITSYRGDAKAAPISMAQHARPHWYTQREYLRLMLRSAVRGLGILPRSTRPTGARPSARHRRGRARG